MNGFMHTEATGVFTGTLLEDMVDTVKKVKKLYCDVDIPAWYNPDYKHPLTYVPLWAFGLPLRKGDKVKVRFEQGDLCNPVLWKVDECNDLDINELYDKWNIPDFVNGGNTKKPEADDTVSAEWLGKDCYVIHTESYTVFHQNNGFILIDKDDRVVARGKGMNLVSVDDMNIDVEKKLSIHGNDKVELKASGNISSESDESQKIKARDAVSIEAGTGKVAIQNNTGNIGKLLDDILDKMNDLSMAVSRIKTGGAPTNHVLSPDDVLNFSTTIPTQLKVLKQRVDAVFKND